LNETLAKLIAFWNGMSTGRRIAAGTLLLFVGLSVGTLSYFSSTDEYATVFAGLKAEDASAMVAKLDEMKIPHQLDAGGTAIKVPAQDVHKVRLQLASEGLPSSGGVGFELFDEPKFGMTDFEQKMNYRRALQGELQRTIVSLTEVEEARIHLVLPKHGTFREDDQAASASVVLGIRGGAKLPADTVRGIVNLIASSVEGLEPDAVTVLDQAGQVLSGPSDPTLAGTLSSLDYKGRVEQGIESRILHLVEPAFGYGKVRAQVTTELDFRTVSQVDELYDPDKTAIRSRHTKKEQGPGGSERAEGVPGVRGNLPGAAPGTNEAAGGGGTVMSEETANFEVNLTKRTVTEPVGEIQKIHVAVLVDGDYKLEGETLQYTPRSDEEITQLESLVKTAVGFDASRGDQVMVSNMQFVKLGEDDMTESSFMVPAAAWPLIRYGVVVFLAALLLVFVLRPLLRTVTRTEAPSPSLTYQLDAAGDPIRNGALPAEVNNRAELRRLAASFASSEPRKTAQILRTWILEDGLEQPVQAGRTSSAGS
jgi:flagellar M-ring protein FliF